MSFVDNLIKSFAHDRVAVLTQNSVQVFKDARTLKASIKEQAKLMQHPIETGAKVTDHRIIMPIEIELSMVVQSESYTDVYNSIRQLYLNSELLIVRTMASIYTNQIIQAMPHEENPDFFNTISIVLNLKQVQFVVPQFGILPKKDINKSTVERGVIQTKTPTNQQQTALAEGFDSAKKGIINFLKKL